MIDIKLREGKDGIIPVTLATLSNELDDFEDYKRIDLSLSGFKVEVVQDGVFNTHTVITISLKPGYTLVKGL